MNEALQGIKVLDLSRILAGPWCTQLLADMGADVIKIEHPDKGDDTRHLGPPWTTDTSGEQGPDATYFASTNRSKKSLGIDISNPEGAGLIKELAAKCDVFIENFMVGGLAKYGLDYESIREVNPEIVYCSITGYGQTGPYASRPGYDFVFQAEGGLMSITGERDDRPGGGPQKAGIPLVDLTTGLYASTAILAALNYRNVTGLGQYIDMSLLDCVAALGSNQGTYHLVNKITPRRWGNGHPSLVPYQTFDTKNGQIVVAIANDGQWQRFCVAMKRDDLAQDPRFKTATGRINHRDALLAESEATIREGSFEHWMELFTELNIPHGKINNYEEVFRHPQIVHRQMAVDVKNEDDDASVTLIANPIKFSRTPVQYRHAPPRLGRHTRETLMEMLGLSDADIEALGQRKVICDGLAATAQQ